MINKLNLPETWKSSFSEYPNGYSLLEAIIEWHSKVNDLIDWANITPDKVLEILQGWLDDGTIEDILGQANNAQIQENTGNISINRSLIDAMQLWIDNNAGLSDEQLAIITSISQWIEDNEDGLTQLASTIRFKDTIANTIQLYKTIPIREFSGTSVYAGLQGSKIIGNSLYFAMNHNTSGNNTAIIMEFNLLNMTLTRSSVLPLYHANDIAYCPNYKGQAVLVLTHTQQDTSGFKVSVVKLSDLTLLETKTLSKYVYNISFNLERNQFVGAGASEINIYDSDLNFVRNFPFDFPGYTPQGGETFDNIFISMYSHTTALFLYDLDTGKLLKKYPISGALGEIESASYMGDGEIIVGFNDTRTGTLKLNFYKMQLFNSGEIFNTTTENGSIPYNIKERSIDIYVDGSYNGESDGTPGKPFPSIESCYGILPTNSTYVDLYISPGTYNENVLLEYFSAVNINITKWPSRTGTVRIKSISGKTIMGELITNDITIYGTNNRLLSSTQNGIELVDVFKYRPVNTRIELDGSSLTRGIRALNTNILLMGSLTISGTDCAMQIEGNSFFNVESGATLPFSNNIYSIINRTSTVVLPNNLLAQIIGTMTTDRGGITRGWDSGSEALPISTGDVVSVVQSYVNNGMTSGHLVFSTNSTNMPSGYTAGYLSFKAFAGATDIYVDFINFGYTGSMMYFGRISGSAILWKKATLS